MKQTARKNIKINDRELDKKLDKELTEKMINPYYFTDKILKIGFKINLESQNINHVNSLLNIEHNFPHIGIQTRYI